MSQCNTNVNRRNKSHRESHHWFWRYSCYWPFLLLFSRHRIFSSNLVIRNRRYYTGGIAGFRYSSTTVIISCWLNSYLLTALLRPDCQATRPHRSSAVAMSVNSIGRTPLSGWRKCLLREQPQNVVRNRQLPGLWRIHTLAVCPWFSPTKLARSAGSRRRNR